MTAAEYLTNRGWWKVADDYGDEEENVIEWCDPASESVYPLLRAVIIQRARDEEKACEAWVAFAAGQLVSDQLHYNAQQRDDVAPGERNGGEYTGAADTGCVAEGADALLEYYRARFCPEVES